MPRDETSKQLSALTDQMRALQAKISIFESNTDSMPPSVNGPLFGDPLVIQSWDFPPGACVWWPYDTSEYPIPSGWEEATEMRGLYPVGYDPENADYDAVGVGLNTNAWTGFDKHGGDENDHEDHNLNHSHELLVDGPNPVPGSWVLPTDPGWCAALAIGQYSTVICDPENPGEGGGITWCDEAGETAAVAHSETDNRPRSFVGIWIRRPLPAS